MSLLSTNVHTLLMEAARSELSAADNIAEDDVESSFEQMWANMPELKDTLFYTEEQVPVFRIGGEAEPITVVEFDSLAKYMESNNVTDVVDALNKLREYYELDELSIAVESYDEASEVLEEAKVLGHKAGNKVGLAKIKASTELIKDLKEKEIKIFKQKGKKKGKKK